MKKKEYTLKKKTLSKQICVEKKLFKFLICGKMINHDVFDLILQTEKIQIVKLK